LGIQWLAGAVAALYFEPPGRVPIRTELYRHSPAVSHKIDPCRVRVKCASA
jgi:hypothetical protein